MFANPHQSSLRGSGWLVLAVGLLVSKSSSTTSSANNGMIRIQNHLSHGESILFERVFGVGLVLSPQSGGRFAGFGWFDRVCNRAERDNRQNNMVRLQQMKLTSVCRSLLCKHDHVPSVNLIAETRAFFSASEDETNHSLPFNLSTRSHLKAT